MKSEMTSSETFTFIFRCRTLESHSFSDLKFLLLQDFYGSHGAWAFKLVLSDFLNLVNLILNILFLHWYLRGHFVDYGVEFVSYQLEETKLPGIVTHFKAHQGS